MRLQPGGKGGIILLPRRGNAREGGHAYIIAGASRAAHPCL